MREKEERESQHVIRNKGDIIRFGEERKTDRLITFTDFSCFTSNCASPEEGKRRSANISIKQIGNIKHLRRNGVVFQCERQNLQQKSVHCRGLNAVQHEMVPHSQIY